MRARKFADEKLLTKRVLVKNNVATPKLYASFYKFKDLDDFDWDSLPQDFVVKPNAGYGGEGILLVRKFKNGKGETTDQNNIDSAGLKRHIQDILDGNYSLNQVPDAAFIEERIRRSKTFKKYTWRGAPDIRVIVFNKVPVMAEDISSIASLYFWGLPSLNFMEYPALIIENIAYPIANGNATA